MQCHDTDLRTFWIESGNTETGSQNGISRNMPKSTKYILSLLKEVSIHRLPSEENKSTPSKSEDTFSETISAGVLPKPAYQRPISNCPLIVDPSSLCAMGKFCHMPTSCACHATMAILHSALLQRLPAYPPQFQEMTARALKSLRCMYKLLSLCEVKKLTRRSSTDSEDVGNKESQTCAGRFSTDHQQLASTSLSTNEMCEEDFEDSQRGRYHIAGRLLERYVRQRTYHSAIAPQAPPKLLKSFIGLRFTLAGNTNLELICTGNLTRCSMMSHDL